MKTKILTTLCLTLAVAAVVGMVRLRQYSYEIKGVSYAEASEAPIIRMFIPPQANKITALIMPNRMNIEASFEISEADFLAWGKQNGFQSEHIENVTVANISSAGNPNARVEIADGWLYRWTYNESDPGSTFKVYAYDRQTGTGFFTQWGD